MLEIPQTPEMASSLEETISRIRQTVLDSQTEKDYFVPLHVSVGANATDALFKDEVNQFIASREKILTVVGPAYSGKTEATKDVEAQLWKDYKPGGLIPLRISLPSLQEPLYQLMPESLTKAGFNDKEIVELQKSRRLLLILEDYDGLDDYDPENKRLQYPNLYVTNGLADWLVKLIITIRCEYLYGVDNYSFWFKPIVKGRAQNSLYKEIIIQPVTVKQIEYYLQQVVQKRENEEKDWQWYQKAIKVRGLENLITNLDFLKKLVKILPKIESRFQEELEPKRTQMIQASCYDAYIKCVFNRQERRLKETKKIGPDEDIKPFFWSHWKILAQLFKRAKVVVVSYEEDNYFDDREENPWSPFFAHPSSLMNSQRRLGLLRTACLVPEIKPHHYAFTIPLDHLLTRNLYPVVSIPGLESLVDAESLVDSLEATGEFLIPLSPCIVMEASSTLKEIEKESECPTLVFKTTPLHSQEKDYINQRLFGKELHLFLTDKAASDKTYRAFLLEQVEASKNHPERGIAGSNVGTILSRLTFYDDNMISDEDEFFSLAGRDWSGVEMPDVDFSNGLLSGLNLSDANLKNGKFFQTCLVNADVRGADLSNANFGQLILFQLGARVNALHYSPDGKWLITGDSSGTITLWDAETQTELKQIICRTEYPANTQFCYSCHPRLPWMVVASTNDKQIGIWDLTTGQMIRTLETIRTVEGNTDSATTVAFSGDGCYVVSAGKDTVHVWNTDSGKLKQSIQQFDYVPPVVFSPDGNLFGSGWLGSALRRSIQFDYVTPVAISPDGNLVVSGRGVNILVWNVNTGKLRNLLKGHASKITVVAFNPNGRLIISGGFDKTIRVWDVESGETIKVLNNDKFVKDVAFSPDSRHLAMTSWDATVRLWNLENGEKVKLEGHADAVTAVTFNPDGSRVVSGDNKGKIIVWDGSSHKLSTRDIEIDNFAMSIAFSTDGRCFAAIFGKKIRLIDTANGKVRQVIERSSEVYSIAFNPKGTHLAWGEFGGDIVIWDLTQQRVQHVLKKYPSIVSAIAFSPDGNLVVSGNLNGTVAIWDANSGKLKQVQGPQKSITAIAFSPDGRCVASASIDKTVCVWYFKDDQKTLVLTGHTAVVTAVVFSRNSRLVASANSDRIICVWDITTNQVRNVLKGHTDNVKTLAFSQNDRYLISGSWDNTVRIWDMVTHNCIAVLPNGIHPVIAISCEAQQIWVVNNFYEICVWRIPRTPLERYALIKTTGSWPLAATGLLIKDAKLSQNYTLLKKLGAIDNSVATEETSASLSGETFFSSSADKTVPSKKSTPAKDSQLRKGFFFEDAIRKPATSASHTAQKTTETMTGEIPPDNSIMNKMDELFLKSMQAYLNAEIANSKQDEMIQVQREGVELIFIKEETIKLGKQKSSDLEDLWDIFKNTYSFFGEIMPAFTIKRESPVLFKLVSTLKVTFDNLEHCLHTEALLRQTSINWVEAQKINRIDTLVSKSP